jgi:hypothetical protein
MRWPEFDRALCEEIRKFQIPRFYVPIAAASDKEIGTVIADLDCSNRAAVDVIVTGFCETGNWRIRSHNERVLIWLRLNFAWQALGFLALGMQDCDPQWMPFTLVARIHDDCDDASLWRWFLIDAWHRCGVAHIQNTFNCIDNLRRVPSLDVQE